MDGSSERILDSRPSYSKAPIDSLGDSSEELPMHHDYESPRDLPFVKEMNLMVGLKELDGSRRKKNLFYEPSIPLRPLKNGSIENCDVDGGYSVHAKVNHDHEKLYKFLFVMLFLLCLGAFCLSALTSLGMIGPKCSCAIAEKAGTTSQYLLSERPTPPVNTSGLEALQTSLSYITAVVVPFLQAQITQISIDKRGPQGPPGPQGPRGPPGPKGGDLTACAYKSTMVEAKMQEPAKQVQAFTKKISAPDGYTVLGASCATLGGSEHGLFTEVDGGKILFQCRCGGKASSAVFSTEYEGNMIKCWIHWWECPA